MGANSSTVNMEKQRARHKEPKHHHGGGGYGGGHDKVRGKRQHIPDTMEYVPPDVVTPDVVGSTAVTSPTRTPERHSPISVHSTTVQATSTPITNTEASPKVVERKPRGEEVTVTDRPATNAMAVKATAATTTEVEYRWRPVSEHERSEHRVKERSARSEEQGETHRVFKR